MVHQLFKLYPLHRHWPPNISAIDRSLEGLQLDQLMSHYIIRTVVATVAKYDHNFISQKLYVFVWAIICRLWPYLAFTFKNKYLMHFSSVSVPIMYSLFTFAECNMSNYLSNRRILLRRNTTKLLANILLKTCLFRFLVQLSKFQFQTVKFPVSTGNNELQFWKGSKTCILGHVTSISASYFKQTFIKMAINVGCVHTVVAQSNMVDVTV